MWADVHALLDVPLIAPDLRGFGATPLGDDEPSVDVYADDVVAELDRRGIDQAVVGGVSLGGYIVMSMLRRYPTRIAAVVLADTKAAADTADAAANRLRIADRVVADGSSHVLVDELAPRLVGTTTHAQRRDVLARVTELVQSASPAAVAWAQRAMAARPDSSDVLAGASVPALVLVGAEDVITPESDARAIVDGMPNARLVVLPEAGHLSPLETPGAFASAVGEFVAALPSTPTIDDQASRR